MTKKFGSYLQANFFPIEKKEVKIVFGICLLKGITSSVYAILINLKDALVVNAQGSGAEALTVVRGFVVLPFSILLVLVYSCLSNKYRPTTIFYIIMGFFTLAFTLYAFVLRPYEFFFTPTNSADNLLELLGSQNKHWVAIYRNWIHAFFYVLSELWLQSTIFILFWEFVNRVCTIDLAMRSYNIFVASGSIFNVSTAIIMFNFIKYFSGSFNLKLQFIVVYIILCITAMTVVYYYLNKNSIIIKKSAKKTKLSFMASLKHILSSKYLLSIAVMTISLGLCTNLLSITWKANLKNLYPMKDDYINFMIKANGVEHFISFVVLFFLSGKMLRSKGWKISASITPFVILFIGSIFLLSSKIQNFLIPITSVLGITTLKFVVLLGAFQVVITKIARYCFYDMTKEIAYVPLDNESKVKGKAAIDTVGSRLGKSASSFIHLGILWLAGTSSVLNVTIYIIPILVAICAVWLLSVNFLAKKLN